MKKNEKTTKQAVIQQVLHNVLLLEGKMNESLYKHEMEEHIGYWTEGMRKDKNDLVFVVTENNGHAAMVIITKKEELLINEPARAYLQKIWQKNYDANILRILPSMAEELNNGFFSVTGVFVLRQNLEKYK
jgi:hypothetical protein